MNQIISNQIKSV